jgi:trehalose-6-phosphate synthase
MELRSVQSVMGKWLEVLNKRWKMRSIALVEELRALKGLKNTISGFNPTIVRTADT